MGRHAADAHSTELGRRLRGIREAAGIKATPLSVKAGVSRSMVYHIENGLVVDPSGSLIARLAALLATTSDHLLSGKGRPPSAKATRAAFARASSVARSGRAA